MSGAPQIVDRLNLPAGQAKAVTPAGPAQRPQGMVALDDISPAIQVAKMTPTAVHNVGGWIASAVISTTGGTLTEASAQPTTPAAPGGVAGLHTAVSAADHTLVNAGGTAATGAGGVTSTAGGGITTGGGGTVFARPIIDWSTDPDVPDLFKGVHANLPAQLVFPSDQTAFTAMQESFRTVASAVGAYVNTAAIQFPDSPPLAGSPSLKTARDQLRARLDPELTMRARVGARVPLGTGVDPLQPLTAAPSFPQAMYAPLSELGSERMLPGLSNVPNASATLLETNPRFVEAYLVGLNEEMARELVWREFPTGLKATYFQNFWGAKADIPSIDGFDGAGHLGDHTSDHATGGKLVLLIRAELFRRYPSAVVSAIQAQWNSDGKTRGLGTDKRYPLFRGQIGPDVNFFGFDVDDPRGSDDPAAKRPGWFFVIEEHITEPRFGLEPDADASTQSWNDFELERCDAGARVFESGGRAPGS